MTKAGKDEEALNEIERVEVQCKTPTRDLVDLRACIYEWAYVKNVSPQDQQVFDGRMNN